MRDWVGGKNALRLARQVVIGCGCGVVGGAYVLPAGAVEQPASLATDRPGNGNASSVVPGGSLQLETSVSYESRSAFTAPTTLRFGLLDVAELRLGSALLGIDAGPSGDVFATDTAVGTKVGVYSGESVSVASGLDVFLPTGAGPFGASGVNGEARLACSFTLPGGFGVLTNVGADAPGLPETAQARPLHVLNLNYALPFSTPSISVFVESFGRHPLDGEEQIWQVDAGFTYLISPLLQLDAFTQHGLTSASPVFIGAVGFSTRWDDG